MNANALLQISLYVGALLLCAKPLGVYMANVYEGKPTVLSRWFGWAERLTYRLCAVRADEEMNWKQYASALMIFNVLGVLAVYSIQRFQRALPLNPAGMGEISPYLAFNTAVSFVSNTNWQSYGGESTMSYLTQMLALTVQNFLSAATGMAVLIALIRGFARRRAQSIGNFWVDLVRSTLYILIPMSIVLAGGLIWQGVPQTFRNYETVRLIQPLQDGDKTITEQTMALGPVASQVAIKQLGTNGGGFFSVNSAHPLENPTPLSNFLQMLAINLIGAAFCYSFGAMVGDKRQGWAILIAMTIIFIPMLLVCFKAEQIGNPAFAKLGIDQAASAAQAGGNMEGKEARFGIVNSAIWATATTAASNGSVNAMHDSFTPLGGLVPLVLMQLGEVVYGGVGSGLYGMLIFILIAVFVAGLMVGRTPEYLGKKIEAFEMKMASLVILIPPMIVLLGTATACVASAGRAGIANPGAHGFSEMLYAFSSAGNNNGSAFAGLSANTAFYNVALGIAMLIARYGLILPVLAVAGSLAAKNAVPESAGTLPTHTPLFIGFVVAIVLVVGALTFFPSLALGPIVEHLMLKS